MRQWIVVRAARRWRIFPPQVLRQWLNCWRYSELFEMRPRRLHNLSQLETCTRCNRINWEYFMQTVARKIDDTTDLQCSCEAHRVACKPTKIKRWCDRNQTTRHTRKETEFFVLVFCSRLYTLPVYTMAPAHTSQPASQTQPTTNNTKMMKLENYFLLRLFFRFHNEHPNKQCGKKWDEETSRKRLKTNEMVNKVWR